MFSYEIYEIFKNTFVYRTSLLWWVLLAVNSVNQWKHALKIYAAKKKWYTWTVLLRLVFLDTEYSSEIVQQLLAVPHFGKVAWKSQKQSSRELFCKKRCSWKILKPQVFSCEFSEIFKITFFHRTPPVAASEKLKAEAVVRRYSVQKLFLEILLNSQENTCVRVFFYSFRSATLIK